ncbi:hypothetical protein I79_002867 [Cricetulus griseus]|uniref:Uncharacterized protein n=1 Tax=Cricetulus griseus TaxID=10029 RepID=G3GYI8_CRIGR|nr:hypothetical protein I79_002867 [Cricetulus griseus]
MPGRAGPPRLLPGLPVRRVKARPEGQRAQRATDEGGKRPKEARDPLDRPAGESGKSPRPPG